MPISPPSSPSSFPGPSPSQSPSQQAVQTNSALAVAAQDTTTPHVMLLEEINPKAYKPPSCALHTVISSPKEINEYLNYPSKIKVKDLCPEKVLAFIQKCKRQEEINRDEYRVTFKNIPHFDSIFYIRACFVPDQVILEEEEDTPDHASINAILNGSLNDTCHILQDLLTEKIIAFRADDADTSLRFDSISWGKACLYLRPDQVAQILNFNFFYNFSIDEKKKAGIEFIESLRELARSFEGDPDIQRPYVKAIIENLKEKFKAYDRPELSEHFNSFLKEHCDRLLKCAISFKDGKASFVNEPIRFTDILPEKCSFTKEISQLKGPLKKPS